MSIWKTLLAALQIPGAIAKITDFFRWLWGKFQIAEAEKQHAENKAAIDAAFSPGATSVQHPPAGDSENQPRPAPSIPPSISGGEGRRP